MSTFNKKVSILLPCYNEEEALGKCLNLIISTLKTYNLSGEIIVSDSSSDDSHKIASQYDVRIIRHGKIGYGKAYLEGLKHAKGEYIFMADCDGSYDFREIPNFIEQLENGYDFVIGNRFKGKIDPGAMPWLHRYIGNPLLSSIFRQLFNSHVGDVHCGMRALRRDAIHSLELKTPGMEFASEMIAKAHKKKLKIKEIPINYHKRMGESKLRTFIDGWRHLRFMFSKLEFRK